MFWKRTWRKILARQFAQMSIVCKECTIVDICLLAYLYGFSSSQHELLWSEHILFNSQSTTQYTMKVQETKRTMSISPTYPPIFGIAGGSVQIIIPKGFLTGGCIAISTFTHCRIHIFPRKYNIDLHISPFRLHSSHTSTSISMEINEMIRRMIAGRCCS